MATGKKVSFLNNANTEVAVINEQGKFINTLNGGGFFGYDLGSGMYFDGNALNFRAYGSGRFKFNSIYPFVAGNIIELNPTMTSSAVTLASNLLSLSPTINQTGSSTSVIRSLYINPTLTSAADYRAIEVTNGKVIIPNGSASNEAVNKGQLDLALSKSGDTITGNILNTATGFFEVASGTTAQRPSTPLDGMIRYNTTTARFEFYANGAWRNMARLEGDTFTGAITATNLSGTNTGDQSENNVYLSHDFLTLSVNDFVNIAVINSGTITNNISNLTVNNPGICRKTSSTSANSGVAIRSSGDHFLLKGNEVFTEIINPLLFTNTTHRAGIHDSKTSADANNGVYFEYSGSGVLVLKTANNGTRTTSSTITTLSLTTWYKLRITVNANATSVVGEVFDNTGTLIATSPAITTNIPTTARLLNVCSITTNSGTTAVALLDIDFIGLKTTLTR